ncbi:hypothetical protein [Geomicrobium sp. JCM 19038]|uniref:hypothetical protein n=1 Tax=Geomicrobium sp. JCM 19038 TaxID=1460635 RepID=UPI00045F2CBD|nr:hypothetical protein [Geomicrobium sp. JCM 19038]GAK10064.1 hypothetical protein JCM19038_3945 [Geomicrobium sp. JCM 19038]
MSKEGKKWTAWVVIGGIAAFVAYIISNKKTREKTIGYVREGAQFIDETGKFVKENQEEIRSLIKDTSTKVNTLVTVASSEIEQIAKHTSHLKTTATDLIDTAKSAAEEIKHQKNIEDDQSTPDNLTYLDPR